MFGIAYLRGHRDSKPLKGGPGTGGSPIGPNALCHVRDSLTSISLCLIIFNCIYSLTTITSYATIELSIQAMRVTTARLVDKPLKGDCMKATTVKLSAATVSNISAWANKSLTTDKAKVKAIDSMHADGVTAAMLLAPAKGESTALFDSVKVSIVLGFTASVQTLLKKDTKGLSDAQKIEKRNWQQQIGSKMKDLRNALTRREAKVKAEMEGSDGAGSDKASWESTKRTVLADMIKQAQGKEASTINNIAMFIKDLQSALARIPASA